MGTRRRLDSTPNAGVILPRGFGRRLAKWTPRGSNGALDMLSSIQSAPTIYASVPEPQVDIVRAHKEELPAVQRLAARIWRAHYPGIVTDDQIDYMLERGYALDVLEGFLDAPASRGFEVAKAGAEIIGFAAWYVTERADEAKLDKLYVLQSQQRLGVGRRLVGRVEDQAARAGARGLILNVNRNNVQAIRAYEKYGFTVREAVVVDIGNGFAMDDYVMAKAI